MTTYNTGAPIGSTNVKDLYDNAQNLDIALHTPKETWVDRLGKTRRSWAGATGYDLLGDYAAGIEVTAFNQIIRDPSGEFWRASAGTILPYITTGSGMPEGGAFVSVGDAALRQQLADNSHGNLGAALVGIAPELDYPADSIGYALKSFGINVGQLSGVDVTGTTSSAAAIETIINNAAEYSTIIFPPGTYNLAAVNSVKYNDSAQVDRLTSCHILNKKNLTILCFGARFQVTGAGPERVGFYFDQCENIRVVDACFPNLEGTNSAGPSDTDYLPHENYYPFAFNGCKRMQFSNPYANACRSFFMLDNFYGDANEDFAIENMQCDYVCNYPLIVRNGKKIITKGQHDRNTGRYWNTSNESVAFATGSTHCWAIDCLSENPSPNATLGTVSRFTSGQNDGPNFFINCFKIGGGIWMEIYEASNVTAIGGGDDNDVDDGDHILFTADTFERNANVKVIGASFKGGGILIRDYYESGWTAGPIRGFIMKGCTALDVMAAQMSPTREATIIEGNYFELKDGAVEFWLGGNNSSYINNQSWNLSLRTLGNRPLIKNNMFTGNFDTNLSYIFNFDGCDDVIERDNRWAAGSFTRTIKNDGADRFSALYLGSGAGPAPSSLWPSKIKGRVGDVIACDTPDAGTPKEWVCVVAGSPGEWNAASQKGFRTGNGAPAFNAQFVGEDYFDVTNRKWYRATATGTGAADWAAF